MSELIYIANMCNDSNKGDLAILVSTVNLLKKKFPNSRIVVQNADYSSADMVRLKVNRMSGTFVDDYYGSFFPSIFPKGVRKIKAFPMALKNLFISFGLLLHAVMSRGMPSGAGFLIPASQRRAWEALVNSDLVVMKGGSYIFSFGPPKDLLFIYRMLFAPLVAILLKKEVIFLSHSVGPVKGRIPRFLTRYVLNRSAAVLLRERLSYEYLKEDLKIKDSRLSMVPDLAFGLEDNILPSDSGDLKKCLQNENPAPDIINRPLLGVTVRNWEFPGQNNPGKLFEDYIRDMVEALNFAAREFGATIFFIPHCLDDLSAAEKVFKGLEDQSRAFILRGDYSLGELRSLLASLDLLIGTRIHSNILAVSVGTPVIPISYQTHKGYGIMGMVGAGQYTLDISHVDVPRLKEHIRRLLDPEENAAYRRVLNGRVREIRQEIYSSLERLAPRSEDGDRSLQPAQPGLIA